MPPRRFRSTRLLFGALLALGVSGCATLQQLASLRSVDFSLDGVSGARLAGIDLSRIESYGDLALTDIARLGLAVTQRQVPLDFQLLVRAENPEDNPTARLVRMGWTLLLEERETLSGTLDDEVVLPPGEARTVPIAISLNLVEFFEGSGQDLLELALSLAGQGGSAKAVALQATPVIQTPLGPVRYPGPITIVQTVVGQ